MAKGVVIVMVTAHFSTKGVNIEKFKRRFKQGLAVS